MAYAHQGIELKPLAGRPGRPPPPRAPVAAPERANRRRRCGRPC
jgi:hypothetical protein